MLTDVWVVIQNGVFGVLHGVLLLYFCDYSLGQGIGSLGHASLGLMLLR
jgi:hypothetical protein